MNSIERFEYWFRSTHLPRTKGGLRQKVATLLEQRKPKLTKEEDSQVVAAKDIQHKSSEK
jgi:hypothetical protein